MRISEDPPAGAPEWMLTYGDMMTLLLTIFVMLVSMGELKQTDKFQGVADSLHEQFGYENLSLLSDELRPRNPMLAALAIALRSQRQNAIRGENQTRPAAGESDHVRLVRPGDRTTVGTAIFFDDRAVALSNQNKADLRGISDLLGGKPQKIEIRGHTAQQLKPNTAGGDHWELAYHRARATMQFLVDELKVDPARIRISAAGPYEPMPMGPDPQRVRANSRVEVFLLEEVTGEPVNDLQEQSDQTSAAEQK